MKVCSCMNIHDVILYPLISEKTMLGISDLKYTSKVRKDASKVDVRNAVEKIFNVKVLKVNIRYLQFLMQDIMVAVLYHAKMQHQMMELFQSA